jgi:hypothetical protein
MQESGNSGLSSVAAEKKKEQDERLVAGVERQGLARDKITTQGQIVFCKLPEDARLADLFQGDEVGNAAHLDLGKVQMFFFTLIVVFAYAVALAHAFYGVRAGVLVAQLPDLDQGMLALLGISNAGFLTNSAVPHSVS